MKKVFSNHLMGKETGYEIINGEYHIAPKYWEQFDELKHKEIGIRRMLEMVTDHASEDLKVISEQRQKVFKTISEDIGIDLSQPWYFLNGVLKINSENKKG